MLCVVNIWYIYSFCISVLYSSIRQTMNCIRQSQLIYLWHFYSALSKCVQKEKREKRTLAFFFYKMWKSNRKRVLAAKKGRLSILINEIWRSFSCSRELVHFYTLHFDSWVTDLYKRNKVCCWTCGCHDKYRHHYRGNQRSVATRVT